MKPTFATKVTFIRRVGPKYTIDCFADIRNREASTVTGKLDLDQT